MQRTFELRVTYWRVGIYAWGLIAAIAAAFVIWPTRYWFGNWLAGICVVALMLYPFWYVRKTRVAVEHGQLRVYDLAWPDQSMEVNDAARIRRNKQGYWEIYSNADIIVKIRPVWNRTKMNELAEVLNVPIKGWGDK